MSERVTLNVTQSDGTVKKMTVLTERKEYINSVVNVGKDNTITASEAEELQKTLSNPDGGSDVGVLEGADLSPKQKLNLAQNFQFGDYYDIKLSDDGKYFQVTVKDAGLFTKNPTLSDIKSDFGVKNNVFVTKDGIPHGNEDVISQNAIPGSTPDGRNTDYNATPIKVGQTINIPVSEIDITGSPRGFFGRTFLP